MKIPEISERFLFNTSLTLSGALVGIEGYTNFIRDSRDYFSTNCPENKNIEKTKVVLVTTISILNIALLGKMVNKYLTN